MQEQLIIRIEPEKKESFRNLAEKDHRSMTSMLLSMIDEKLAEAQNGK